MDGRAEGDVYWDGAAWRPRSGGKAERWMEPDSPTGVLMGPLSPAGREEPTLLKM